MDIITETLRWVNQERAARGIGEPLERMPKGQPGSTCYCPVALALNPRADNSIEVSSQVVFFYDDGREECIDVPENVEAFIDAFDQRRLPDLIAR